MVFDCDYVSDSTSLAAYVSRNNVITWHGAFGIGNLSFIDSPDLHIVFNSRREYESWEASGRPVDFQFRLF